MAESDQHIVSTYPFRDDVQNIMAFTTGWLLFRWHGGHRDRRGKGGRGEQISRFVNLLPLFALLSYETTAVDKRMKGKKQSQVLLVVNQIGANALREFR